MRYLIVFVVLTFCSCSGNDIYVAEIEQWRKDRIQNLTAPIGWASLAGLYWIDEDTTRIGGSEADIVLSENISGSIGQIIRIKDKLFYENSIDGIDSSRGQQNSQVIHTDQDDKPSRFNYKNWEWTFIERGGKTGLRLWDTTHVNRIKFLELDYYPIDPRFKVNARFYQYDTPLERPLQNVLGMSIPQVIPGELRFKLNDRQFSLQVLNGTDEEFFIIFADETTGGDTYGGGRYLYTSKPEPGSNSCEIDFNKAYTPPCGFTEFATCLLPTPDNTLPIEIKAGEMYHFNH